jgi:hypothetical protein
MFYSHLADVVVAVHLAFVVFVLIALLLIVAGIPLRWRWTRNLWFRLVHLASIAIVAGQAVVGVTCPLTDLESYLRAKADVPLEQASVIGRWAHNILFYQGPEAVFMWCYIAFGALVLLTFLLAPPRLRRAGTSARPRTRPARAPEREPVTSAWGEVQSRNAEKMRSNSPSHASSARINQGSN